MLKCVLSWCNFSYFSFVCRQLCVLLNCEDVFKTLAVILLNEKNLKFASSMVEHLNTILLTSPELFSFRVKLKDLGSEVNYMNI